jgi:3-methyladenine DNA glycosylase AlkD
VKRGSTPAALAKSAAARLKREGTSKARNQGLRFFKAHRDIHLFGVPAPGIRKIEKDIFRDVADEWSLEDALSFCHILMANRHLEAKALGILLLSRYKKEFNPTLVRHFEDWILQDLCSNWATIDALSCYVIAPFLVTHPGRIAELHRWVRSPNLWLRRAAAVSLVPLARRGQHLEHAYQVADHLLEDPEDLLHKATGWLLREAGKTDPRRLEKYLTARGPGIPRTALRYAIEKFPPATRKELLRKTRKNPDSARDHSS